jgi:ABC-type amino acid transport substrate-binding protein
MGELVTGKADLALFPLTLTSARAQFIDASPPFMDAGYSLLTRIVRTDESYSFLLPFNWRTWLLLIASLFVVVLALSLLDSATRRARYRALERHYGLERAKVKRRREKAMQYTIESMMMLLGQGGAPRAHSWAVKIMFVCWAVFSVIMLAAYTANLTANLTVSQLSTTIKTLAELKQSGHLFGVPADSSVAKYFKDSSDSLASSLAPSMIEYRDPMQAIRDVRAGKIAAYATDYPVLKGYAADPPCDLFVSEDLFGPSQLVIGMTRLRGPGLAARIDAGLIELDETGVLSDLRRRWFVEMSTCASLAGNGADANASGGLTPGTLYGCFVLLAVGMVIAILWAAAEVGYYRLM